ncbi:SEC-C metal-binding domain-containing protein [Methanolobus sp. ZRKC3]|uniref:SEC-C metal-binding domain-containing protein n=1 Tax=Methanolobus sp. ZRKC3 TaxID=3125786 RepID=UPI003252BD0A
MSSDMPIKPEKMRRNDPCYCGSGKKYKKCCMKKTNSGIKGTIKNFGKTFGKRLIIDNAKKVPIISSAIGAVEDLNGQKEKEEYDSKLNGIAETSSATLDYVANINSLAPIFDPTPSLRKIDWLASILRTTIENNQNYDVQVVSIEQNKRVLKITPKGNPIEFNIRFKVTKQKLEGLSSIEEFIESKIKEGKSAVFTEDDIESFTFLDDEIGQFWENGAFHELEFKPQISDIPFELSFIVKNTEFAYHNVKMGNIYKSENEATLVSTNLPFNILLNFRKDTPILNIKFDINLEEKSILDLNQFFGFLSALNEGNSLLLKDSKRGTVFLTTNETPQFEIDTATANLVQKLAIIDTVYCTNFTYPKFVTNYDTQIINEIVSIIENKCLILNSITATFDSEGMKGILDKYEENGYFENLCADIPLSYELFGKKINIGGGKVIFEKTYIRENILLLKKEASNKNAIEITFVSGDSDARIIFR